MVQNQANHHLANDFLQPISSCSHLIPTFVNCNGLHLKNNFTFIIDFLQNFTHIFTSTCNFFDSHRFSQNYYNETHKQRLFTASTASSAQIPPLTTFT